ELNLSQNFKPDRKRDFQYYQAQPPAPLPETRGTIAHLRPWTFAQIFTHRDYLGIHQAEGRKDAVGLMAINGSAWRRGNGQPYWPEANFSSRDGWKLPDLGQAVQLVRKKSGDVVLRFPMCGGQRITGVAVYDKSLDRGRFVLEDIRHKTSETSLSDVLQMVLDWDDKTPRPHLYGDTKAFDEQRKNYDPKSPQNRWVCEEFRALMADDLSNAEKMRESIVKAAGDLARYWTFPESFEPAENEKARIRKGYVGAGLRAIEVGPNARNLAGRYDLARALGILNGDEKRLVRASLAFAAYKFSDPEFFAPLCALGNFKVDGYFSLAVIALTLPDHPHSSRWLAEAKRQIAEDLDQGIYIYESGAGNECEIYRAMSVNFLTQLAMLFKTHGMPELAEHPRLKQALKWFIEFSVPPVPKVSYGLPRVLPFDGDTTTTTPPVYGMFGMGAALYRESNPQLSRQLNWFWKQSKQSPFRGHGINNLGVLNRLYLRYDLPEESPGPYESHPVEGYGFVFHRNWGTPDEWIVFGKAGPGSGHYHASDGSVQIYAHGKPLVIGYGKYPYITTTWRYTILRLDGRSNWS
ncbi:MAG: heparinase II/III family protein, partial [Planctomycetota bacterium]|nr:heparinase II/III family protein [Planctomycetota bacterium]